MKKEQGLKAIYLVFSAVGCMGLAALSEKLRIHLDNPNADFLLLLVQLFLSVGIIGSVVAFLFIIYGEDIRSIKRFFSKRSGT